MDITIPELSRDTDRGQVGIETLIIFIAMILVAAIAASVLINTAGYLQNQASATSEDSESQVSNQVLVLSSIGEIQQTDIDSETETVELDTDGNLSLTGSTSFEGELEVTGNSSNVSEGVWDLSEDDKYQTNASNNDQVTVTNSLGNSVDLNFSEATTEADLEVVLSSNNAVSDLSMTVMQSPGANEIDLEGASVEYIGPDGEQTLGYTEEDDAGVGDFWVEGTTDPDDTAPVLTSRTDRFTLHVELTDEDTEDLRYLEEGEEATVRIVTQSGSVATVVVNVPQSLSSYEDGDAVEL